MEAQVSGLRKKILEEMTVDYSSQLERSFDLAKRFIRLTKEGTVDILLRERLTGKEQILMYLIGKIFSKEAGLATEEEVGNHELLEQLGLPVGSLLPFLKELREEKKIRQVKREKTVCHTVPPSKIEEILKAINSKLREKG